MLVDNGAVFLPNSQTAQITQHIFTYITSYDCNYIFEEMVQGTFWRMNLQTELLKM